MSSGRRTQEDIVGEANQILHILQTHGAQRAEELADRMRVPARYLEKPLKYLRVRSMVTTAGEKRWTSYAAR